MAGMDLLPAVHHAQYAPSVQSQFTASRCQSIRSRPQISLSQKAMQRTAFGKPMQRHVRSVVICSASSQTISAGSAKPLRFIQHKEEAFWFYRFLSIVYDHIVNPGHWTVDMRTDALEPAKLDSPNLKVVDVGGGTGFCTQGIVKTVSPQHVTLIDQSPHQLEKAKKKPDLQGVTIKEAFPPLLRPNRYMGFSAHTKLLKVFEGDAEDLPFPTDSFDRYVSAGSIEYWPEPQRGIKEAYRVIKEGGIACLIGPVHPTFWLSRLFADAWMLFPTEDEYTEWFTKAGFADVKIKRIGPKWYRGVRRHGLIMGCSVTGVKPKAGESPLDMGPKQEISGSRRSNPFRFLFNLIVGTLAGSYYFFLPVYMWIKNLIWPKNAPGF